MTSWKEISHQVTDRIRKVGSRSISKRQRKNRSKSKIEISPQEAVALIASIVIIIISFGGIGLVHNVFASIPSIALPVLGIGGISEGPVALGQTTNDLERKQTIYSVVENTLKSQYELFMDEFQNAPNAMESESVLSAANKISTIDPVEVTNEIFEREQLKGEVLDNQSIAGEVTLIVMDEVVAGGPSFRNLLP